MKLFNFVWIITAPVQCFSPPFVYLGLEPVVQSEWTDKECQKMWQQLSQRRERWRVRRWRRGCLLWSGWTSDRSTCWVPSMMIPWCPSVGGHSMFQAELRRYKSLSWWSNTTLTWVLLTSLTSWCPTTELASALWNGGDEQTQLEHKNKTLTNVSGGLVPSAFTPSLHSVHHSSSIQ